MKLMDNPKKRASAEQFEVLLLELERRPSLLNLRSNALGSRGNEQWQELADRLNGIGVSKTAAKWQQAWRDWKSNTKKKAAKILEEKAKTGDGKPTLQPLTDLEVRVLNLVGTDLSDIKPPEIDISNIAELDPLSSDEHSHDSGSDTEGTPFICAPDTVTVYSLGEGSSNGITVKAEHDSPLHKKSKKHRTRKPKRHRVEFRHNSLSSERLRKETSSLLTRLTTLEESRQSSERQTTSVLERIARALEDNTAALRQQAAAAENQARALQRLTVAIESRYLYNSTT